MTLRFALAAMVLSSFVLPAHAEETEINSMTVIDPWACAGDTAVYMQIRAPEAAGDVLTGASAEIAEKVEIHTYVWEYGVLRLRPVETIEIEAEETVELKPGSHHLRLLELAEPLETGAVFELELTFTTAGEGVVEVPVVECRGQLKPDDDITPPATGGETPPPGTTQPETPAGVIPIPIPVPVPWPGSY